MSTCEEMEGFKHILTNCFLEKIYQSAFSSVGHQTISAQGSIFFKKTLVIWQLKLLICFNLYYLLITSQLKCSGIHMLISNLKFLFCAFLHERTLPIFFWGWGIYLSCYVSVWLGYARCPYFSLDIAAKVVFRRD